MLTDFLEVIVWMILCLFFILKTDCSFGIADTSGNKFLILLVRIYKFYLWGMNGKTLFVKTNIAKSIGTHHSYSLGTDFMTLDGHKIKEIDELDADFFCEFIHCIMSGIATHTEFRATARLKFLANLHIILNP